MDVPIRNASVARIGPVFGFAGADEGSPKSVSLETVNPVIDVNYYASISQRVPATTTSVLGAPAGGQHLPINDNVVAYPSKLMSAAILLTAGADRAQLGGAVLYGLDPFKPTAPVILGAWQSTPAIQKTAAATIMGTSMVMWMHDYLYTGALLLPGWKFTLGIFLLGACAGDIHSHVVMMNTEARSEPRVE